MTNISRVLVIGASGFVGRHAVGHFIRSGFEVTALHSRSEPPDAPCAGVTWVRSDVGEADAANRWPVSCDHVVYLAQSPLWRSFPAGARDMFLVNTAGVLTAVEYAIRAGARSFVHASTGSVYPSLGRPNVESDSVTIDRQASFYSASKTAAECLVAQFASQIPVIRLRIYSPYGPMQNSTMLIPSLVRRVIDGKPIDLHGENGLLTSPLWVVDLAETIIRALASDKSEALNVAGPEILSLRQIGECIARVTGVEARFNVNEGQVAPVAAARTATLRTQLGWAPETTLEAGLQAWMATGEWRSPAR